MLNQEPGREIPDLAHKSVEQILRRNGESLLDSLRSAFASDPDFIEITQTAIHNAKLYTFADMIAKQFYQNFNNDATDVTYRALQTAFFVGQMMHEQFEPIEVADIFALAPIEELQYKLCDIQEYRAEDKAASDFIAALEPYVNRDGAYTALAHSMLAMGLKIVDDVQRKRTADAYMASFDQRDLEAALEKILRPNVSSKPVDLGVEYPPDFENLKENNKLPERIFAEIAYQTLNVHGMSETEALDETFNVDSLVTGRFDVFSAYGHGRPDRADISLRLRGIATLRVDEADRDYVVMRLEWGRLLSDKDKAESDDDFVWLPYVDVILNIADLNDCRVVNAKGQILDEVEFARANVALQELRDGLAAKALKDEADMDLMYVADLIKKDGDNEAFGVKSEFSNTELELTEAFETPEYFVQPCDLCLQTNTPCRHRGLLN